METQAPEQQTQTRKPTIESYYKVLGVRSNAKAETIENSYTRLMEQVTPEQNRERYELICSAYETLRDSDKRMKYDFQLKYDGNLDKLLEEVRQHVEKQQFAKAETLLRRAIQFVPDHLMSRSALHMLLLAQKRYAEFEQEELAMMELADVLFLGESNSGVEDGDGREKLLYLSAKQLQETGYYEEALERLQRLMDEYPSHRTNYTPLLATVYQQAGREEEAFQWVEAGIPSEQEQRPEHAPLFFDWIHVMMRFGKWQYWSKIQPRVKRFLRAAAEEETARQRIVDELLRCTHEYEQTFQFRESRLFADLAHWVQPDHEQVSSTRQRLQQDQRLHEAILRVRDDPRAMRGLYIKALQWFFEDRGQGERFHAYIRNSDPRTLLGPNWRGEGKVVQGVGWLKARHSLVYSSYGDRWERLAVREA